MTRPFVPLKQKLAALVADKLGLSMDQRKSMSADQVLEGVEWDHIRSIRSGGHPKAHWNLQALTIPQHRRKTHSLTGNSDRRLHKLIRKRERAPQPKAKIPSRKMPCGKDSPYKMQLNGKVVARDG